MLSNVISYIRKPSLESNQLPEINIALTNGNQFNVSEGRPLIIHFWATWCPTCKIEASNIESISKEYQVLTVAVNSGSNNDINKYLKERSFSFSVMNDRDGLFAKRFKVEAFPTTFIYDSSGKLKFSEVGYTSTVGLKARIQMSK